MITNIEENGHEIMSTVSKGIRNTVRNARMLLARVSVVKDKVICCSVSGPLANTSRVSVNGALASFEAAKVPLS